MKYKPTDNKLYFTRGTASTKVDGEKIPVEFIYYNNPSCGYHIDPRGFLVLPNFHSISGDIIGKNAIYIVNGTIKTDTVENAIAELESYCSNPIIKATSAKINGCVEEIEGESSVQLEGIVLPPGASQLGTWTSSNPSVATVNAQGEVQTLSEGTTIITFTSTDGGFKDTCEISVTIEE